MSEKKLLSSLTPGELENLYNANSWLKKQCEESRELDIEFELNEIADGLRAAKHLNFEIGGYSDYIRVKNGYYEEYLDTLQDMQNKFYIVGDTLQKTLDRLTEKARFYDSCCVGYEDISEKQFDLLEKWFLSGIKELNDYILEYVYQIVNNYEYIIEELEIVIDRIGNDYETDGTFIYETEVRKYS